MPMLSEAELRIWFEANQKRFPHIFLPEDTLYGPYTRQHAVGQTLKTYFDDDPNKPMECVVIGSHWDHEVVYPGMKSMYAMSKEAMYKIVIGGEISQIPWTSAHEEGGWFPVGGPVTVPDVSGFYDNDDDYDDYYHSHFCIVKYEDDYDDDDYSEDMPQLEDPDNKNVKPLEVGFSGLMISESLPQRNLVLNESDLDRLAATYGYHKVDTSSSTAPMASYRRGSCRLNFWLTTGTVGSYLVHPKKGKSQLFRNKVDHSQADAIFKDPRIHTGKGYSTTKINKRRGPCRYGNDCYRKDCEFQH